MLWTHGFDDVIIFKNIVQISIIKIKLNPISFKIILNTTH